MVRTAWAEAKAAGADMIAFPEMFLTGYQLQDLVKKPAFAMDVHRVMGELAAACVDGPAIGIGGPLPGGASRSMPTTSCRTERSRRPC
jgi:NAD+ synthase